MAVVSFSSGDNVLRLYYTQEYSIGGQKSTITLDRVTAEKSREYAWPGNYFADGKILFDGKVMAAYSLAMANGQCVLSPNGEEHTISEPGTSIEVEQPIGQKKDIAISISGNAYENFMIWKQEDTFSFRGEVKTVELESIPQYTITANSGKFDLKVRRTASPAGAQTGTIKIGDNIYAGDVLHIAAAPRAGYEIVSITANGEAQQQEFDVTANGDIDIQIQTVAIGAVHIDGELYTVHIDNGEEFEQYIPYGDDGTVLEIFT